MSQARKMTALTQAINRAAALCAFVLLLTQAGCAVILLNAAADGNTQKVVSLLQNGHHANEAFPLVGTTPLMLAAAYGHKQTVKALLDAGADVNAEDFTGWTALHAAVFKGDPTIVALLLEHGAFKERSRWLLLETPLRVAERLDHYELLPLLRPAKTTIPKTNQESNASHIGSAFGP